MHSHDRPDLHESLDALFRRGRHLVEASAEMPHQALRFLGGAAPAPRRTPPPGAQPGHLVLPAAAAAPSLRLIVYRPDGFEDRPLATPGGVGSLLEAAEGVAWLDLEGFGERSVLEQLAEELDLHPLALADIVNVPQRPKAELYADRLLLVTQMARLTQGGAVDIEQVSLVLGPGWVATFQERPGDVFEPIRARIAAATARIRQMGADYLAYALLDAVVDGYFPVVEALGGVIDALEEEVVERPARATLARIHATRRTLLALHRAQWQQRDAIATLMRDEELPFTPPVRVFLRDAHDHAFQTVEVMENFRELTVGLLDLYLSSASIRMNDVMKALTIVATLFIPLTFLVGVYGMNFEHMPELRWTWGYPAVWGLMAAITLGSLFWFRRKGWIGTS